MTREALASKLKEAWFSAEPGIPIGQRWNLVADAATEEFIPEPSFVQVDWSGDPVNDMEAPEGHDEPIPGWLIGTPVRDHGYSIAITYPDGSECSDIGIATGAELAHRLRFEANLCDPPEVLPAPDEVVEGAPRWIARNAPKGMPESWTAWNNGVTDSHGNLIEDLAALETTARAMLAAAAQAKAWRRQL